MTILFSVSIFLLLLNMSLHEIVNEKKKYVRMKSKSEVQMSSFGNNENSENGS